MNTESKSAVRKHLLILRDSLNTAQKVQWDAEINAALTAVLAEVQPRVIHTFLPMGSEPNLRPTLEYALERGIVLVAPETLPKGELKHRVLGNLNRVEAGRFGTTHPDGEEYKGEIDLIIVPGLGFNPEGRRLGYGGGYYDRFLSEQEKTMTVAPLYPFQLLEDLPVEEHDATVHRLLIPRDYQ